MRRIRSMMFLAAWGCWTIFAGIAGLPCITSRRATWWLTDVWIDGSLWLLHTIAGISVAMNGTLPTEPCIVASAHQSTLDTLVLWRRLNRPIFILKRELYWIPIFGWYLWRSGQIAIRRRARQKPMAQVMARIGEALKEGRSLIIFPEGTRMPPGETKPYHRGVAMISEAHAAHVIPVAVNTGYYWPKRTIVKTAGVAQFACLEVMPPCVDASDSGWLTQLQSRINAAQAALPSG